MSGSATAAAGGRREAGGEDLGDQHNNIAAGFARLGHDDKSLVDVGQEVGLAVAGWDIGQADSGEGEHEEASGQHFDSSSCPVSGGDGWIDEFSKPDGV